MPILLAIPQQISHTNPLSYQESTRGFQLPIVRVLLPQNLEVSLLIPLQPLLIRLPYMRRHAFDTMLSHCFLDYCLQQVHSDAVCAVWREYADCADVEL